MTLETQIMLRIATERGCSCEMCGAGTWIKLAQIDNKLPDYLVLYHRDGIKENKNINNMALRCTYCAQHRDIIQESFRRPRRRVMKEHGHYGSAWYNNGKMKKFIKSSEFDMFKKMGWERGRMVPKNKLPPNHSGKIRITNGIVNAFAISVDEIPTGWWRGKFNYKKLDEQQHVQTSKWSYNRNRKKKRAKRV